jgi:RHS repeat-associated protein
LLRAQTNTSYDDQGRVYLTQNYSVNPSTGAVSSTALSTNTWYNHRGLVIETSQPGGLKTKNAYDGAGRTTVQYTTDGNGDAAPGTTNSWPNAGTVSSTNNVLVQAETSYDADGNVLLTTTRQRNHDETTGGPLGNETTTPKARVSFVANYYDLANRLATTVDVGTNGTGTYTRPSTPAAASDTVLRTDTSYAGDNVQLVQLTGSPTGGTFTLTFNGQTTSAIAYNASAASVQSALQSLSSIGTGNALVANPTGSAWIVRFAGTLAGAVQPAITGTGSGLTGGTNPSVSITVTSLGGDAGRVQQTTDARGIVMKTDYDWLGRTRRTVEAFSTFNPSSSSDKTTEYTYDGSNHMLTLQADLASSAYQQTKFIYGVTTSGGSNVNSNDILGSMQYPDKTSGNPSSSEQETYQVNALGQRTSFTDRNGNVHSYLYDMLGRPTSNQVTTLGSGVDGAVRRIDTAYDTQGNAYLLTSYSDTGGTTIANQVQRSFNGLRQLTQEWQSHSGAVNTSTTPSVQYGWSLMSGGANHSRLTSITYPNGKVLNYNYNTGLDDSISRLSYLSDTSGTLESYSYLGLSTVVKRAHPLPTNGLDLTYITPGGSGDAGDQYTGLDRFGRIVDQNWQQNTTPNPTITDEFKYGYERDSNRLYRTNEVNHSFDELYHANGSSNGYDNLNQLIAFARGTLNASHDTISSPSHSITWSPDALGNFSSTTTDGGSAVNNSFNKQNEETAAGSANLTFDNNGNTTTDDNSKTLVYDAWNRLVAYKNGATVLESYQYDALNRRIIQNPGTATDLYYSSDWQVLEERTGGVSTATIQYVWSPVYVDALVLRDRSTQNNGTLDERLWVQQDANWNVTALLNGSGSVVERYVYDPYGKVTFLTVSWGTLSVSGYAWICLFQGGRFDPTTGLYNFRHRDTSPSLQRWVRLDPIGPSTWETNLYRYDSNRPPLFTDSSGLIPFPIFTPVNQDGFFASYFPEYVLPVHTSYGINGLIFVDMNAAFYSEEVGYMASGVVIGYAGEDAHLVGWIQFATLQVIWVVMQGLGRIQFIDSYWPIAVAPNTKPGARPWVASPGSRPAWSMDSGEIDNPTRPPSPLYTTSSAGGITKGISWIFDRPTVASAVATNIKRDLGISNLINQSIPSRQRDCILGAFVFFHLNSYAIHLTVRQAFALVDWNDRSSTFENPPKDHYSLNSISAGENLSPINAQLDVFNENFPQQNILK